MIYSRVQGSNSTSGDSDVSETRGDEDLAVESWSCAMPGVDASACVDGKDDDESGESELELGELEKMGMGLDELEESEIELENKDDEAGRASDNIKMGSDKNE